MRHHKHPGIAGRFDAERREIVPHSDAADETRRIQVWIPLPDAAQRDVDSMEGVACVPTRDGAARVVAVPHLASDLAFGDELAVSEWNGDLIARGPLASSLHGTVRIVGAEGSGRDWRDLADAVDGVVRHACETTGTDDAAWYDVIAETSLAVSVPRSALGEVFAFLRDADAATLRWEYATSMRHSDAH